MAPLVAQSIGFLFGLLLGSFLNVCIARVPAGESVVRPRSKCPACGHAVRPYDNVPVVSWLVLRGRCRDCGGRISWRYPVVELGFGLWCLLSTFMLPLSNNARFYHRYFADFYIFNILSFVVLGFLLIGLMVMDWRTQRLPDAFTLTGIAIGFFLVCARTVFLEPGQNQIIFASKHLRLSSPGSFAARGNVFLTGTEALIYGRLLTIVGAALILLVIRWVYKAVRKRDGLGLGDVKLLAMIAAFLGFWPAVLSLFLGVLLATGYALALLARGRAKMLTRLPLGSFLCAGGLLTAIFGERIIAWYTPLVRF